MNAAEKAYAAAATVKEAKQVNAQPAINALLKEIDTASKKADEPVFSITKNEVLSAAVQQGLRKEGFRVNVTRSGALSSTEISWQHAATKTVAATATPAPETPAPGKTK